MYFNEIYNEVEPSNKEKEKITRQNEHNALVSKQMDVKIDNAIKCQSVLEHPTDESGNIILANFHSNNHFGSLKERQQAQQKVQQDASVELLPLYVQWHQVLFSQLEVLWQYKQSHKFAKTHLERLDQKISILVSQLLNNPNLSEEQHKLTIVIAQFYKILLCTRQKLITH